MPCYTGTKELVGPVVEMQWGQVGPVRSELVGCARLQTHPEAWLFYFLSNELCPGRAKSYLSSEEIFHLSYFVENPNKCLFLF